MKCFGQPGSTRKCHFGGCQYDGERMSHWGLGTSCHCQAVAPLPPKLSWLLVVLLKVKPLSAEGASNLPLPVFSLPSGAMPVKCICSSFNRGTIGRRLSACCAAGDG